MFTNAVRRPLRAGCGFGVLRLPRSAPWTVSWTPLWGRRVERPWAPGPVVSPVSLSPGALKDRTGEIEPQAMKQGADRPVTRCRDRDFGRQSTDLLTDHCSLRGRSGADGC